MPSDSIAGFLDRAQASRVLFPEQIEQLIRQPDIPHANLDSLCQYLEERGAITRFQASAIREGRGTDLNFASYPVIEELGPCPGGTAYRALHPSLRTPIELRRFKAESLFPADTPAALLGRAQIAAGLHHANQVTLLDTGMTGEESYAAIDPPTDASPLDSLVRDIGAMPAFLAAEYGRQAASVLRAAHERGLSHGDIRPPHLVVGPMISKAGADGTMKRRPAPNAALKVAELGLVPLRPAAVLSAPSMDALPYMPPERLENSAHEPRGDIYSLGATLYHLLTGRPPFAGGTATELMQKVRSTEPAALASLRPDVPPEFAAFVHRMMAKKVAERPATMFDVEQSLAAFCRPGTVPAAPHSGPVPMAVAHEDEEVPTADPHQSTADEWGASENFTAHAAAAPVPKRQLTAQDKKRTKLLVALGLCLHLSATALVIAWISGAFDRSPEPEPVPTKTEPSKKKMPKRA
ncbi:MAG: serine/threonine-protein kinase [Gemmataceae bacterium]